MRNLCSHKNTGAFAPIFPCFFAFFVLLFVSFFMAFVKTLKNAHVIVLIFCEVLLSLPFGGAGIEMIT